MNKERLITAGYKDLFLPATSFSPELAHSAVMLALKVLEKSPQFLEAAKKEFALENRALRVNIEALGLELPSPFVLAAGMIKNGSGASFMAALGPGGIEAGTFTQEPWRGNQWLESRDGRLYLGRIKRYWLTPFRGKRRLVVINWMGLPGVGIEKGIRNLAAAQERQSQAGMDIPLGVNIAPTPGLPGRPRTLEEDLADLQESLACVFKSKLKPSWVTLNVSCPNVSHGGKRGEQLGRTLLTLEGLAEAAGSLGGKIPLMVKIGPDMEKEEIKEIVVNSEAWGYRGIVATNTTVDRSSGGREVYARRFGGLSGSLLFSRALRTVELIREFDPRKKLVIVGCGGIDSTEKWLVMQKAGASFCQIATDLVARGPYGFKQLKEEYLQATTP